MQRGDPRRARGRRRLTRRTLSSPATVEAYLQAGVMPRFLERLRQIEDETIRQRMRVKRSYDWVRRRYAEDPEGFRAAWLRIARNWNFAELNHLIEQHNEWYPVERRLPLDPRSGDYLTVGGRDWRRRPLDAAWILEQFPASAG